jgi:hypothetical protein
MEKKQIKVKLNKLFQNRTFRVVLGLALLALAYLFASLAIDSGNLLDYAITFLLIFAGFREIASGLFRKKNVR